jgi:hypothetical protein
MPLSAALERRADDIRRFNYVAKPSEILIGQRNSADKLAFSTNS